MNSHCHVAEAKEASFVAKKKTNVFIHAKCPSQAITHASTTECSFVSLILSYFQPNPVIHGPKLQILTWTQYIPYVTIARSLEAYSNESSTASQTLNSGAVLTD